MGRERVNKPKSSSSSSRGNAAELFDSVEMRVHHTPEMRQVSDGILELTRSTGESTEFTLALNSTSSVASPRKAGKNNPNPKSPTRQSRGAPRHGSTTTTEAMTVSTLIASPTKKAKKPPKSSRASHVQHTSSTEPSGSVATETATPAAVLTTRDNKPDEDSPVNLSIPVLDSVNSHGSRSSSDNASGPDPSSSPRKKALRENENDEANGASETVLLSPGAYSVRPGASSTVPDESESTSEDHEDSVPMSATRSVDSSAARSADSVTAAATTVTATAVTRDDLEQEVRERILREAVVAEVMVTAVVEPASAPPRESTAPKSPASVPDGFFTPTSSVPDGFFTSPDSSSRVSFLLPEAPLEDTKSARERSNGTGCCAGCSPCCYAWRWWLVGLFSLLLVMGALGVVFGVVLPSQNKQSTNNPAKPQSSLGNGGLRRTAAPSPQQNLNPIPPTQAPAGWSLTLEPTVGPDTSTTSQPVPAVPSSPPPTMAPATPYPQPTSTSTTPWTADTLLQFLTDNTIDGGMGLTVDGTPAKNAYDAIVGSSAFTGVPLNGQMLDVFTLMCFYLLTNGASTWLNHQGWGEYPNPCEWYGVTCNSASRVASLELPNNGIRGGISMDMNNIRDQLTSLDLSGNQLFFDKANLSEMYRLQHLNVSQASVYGDINTLLGSDLAFPSLQVFDVSSNSLVGPIPSAFGAMTQLRKILVQSNQLTGSIPTELAQLANLNVAKFEGNGLSGSMPEGLCQLKAANGTSSLKMLSADCGEVSCSCCTCF